MRLTHLALSNFRNYAQLEIAPATGLNVFVGANAQGKSNVLEAIAMLGTGKSFRTAHDADTVAFDADRTAVRGDALIAAGKIALAYAISKSTAGTRKTYTLNGRAVRYSNFLGKLRVVTFVPSDLQLAGGPPSLRRAFLNTALAQEDPHYYRELSRYRTTVQQKNALLRETIAPDPHLLQTYDAALIESGTKVMLARAAFAVELEQAAAQAHARFSRGKERLGVAYRSNVPVASWDQASVAGAYLEALQRYASRERARKAALIGPHSDDLELTLDGRPLGPYGSQGQRRTAVLALKTADYAVARRRAGEAPLLLLDDVLSELDEARAAAFLAGVGDYEQAFVTATHVPAAMPGSARVYAIEHAALRIEASACCGG